MQHYFQANYSPCFFFKFCSQFKGNYYKSHQFVLGSTCYELDRDGHFCSIITTFLRMGRSNSPFPLVLCSWWQVYHWKFSILILFLLQEYRYFHYNDIGWMVIPKSKALCFSLFFRETEKVTRIYEGLLVGLSCIAVANISSIMVFNVLWASFCFFFCVFIVF